MAWKSSRHRQKGKIFLIGKKPNTVNWLISLPQWSAPSEYAGHCWPSAPCGAARSRQASPNGPLPEVEEWAVVGGRGNESKNE